MKHSFIIILFFCFGITAFGQTDWNAPPENTDWKERSWNLKASYSYQNYHIISVGIGRLGGPVYMGSCASDPNGGDGFAFSLQSYFRPNYSPLYATAISWEASFLYEFKGMIEASYITNFNKGDIYITPKIGLNIIIFYVVYGYSIGLTNNLSDSNLSKSSITFGVDIPL